MTTGLDVPKAQPFGPDDGPPKTLVILGATGSIGRSTAQILALHPARFEVAAVAGGRDAEGLARVAVALGARFAALADATRYADLKAALAGTGIECAAGPDAVVVVARNSGAAVATPEPPRPPLSASREIPRR